MKTLAIPKDTRKVHPDKAPKEAKPPSNGPGVEDILFFVGQLRAKRALKKLAAKAEGMVRKQAINAGLVIEDLNQEMKNAGMDPEKLMEKYARQIFYAEALGNVPKGQMSLFDAKPHSGIPNLKERGEAAYQSGFARSIMGEFPNEHAYGPTHEHFADHQEGWNAGQQILRERIGQLESSAPIEKKEDEQ